MLKFGDLKNVGKITRVASEKSRTKMYRNDDNGGQHIVHTEDHNENNNDKFEDHND